MINMALPSYVLLVLLMHVI